jgi:hypothetical protein
MTRTTANVCPSKRRGGVAIMALALLAASPASRAGAAVPVVKLRGTSSVRDADNPARHAYHVQIELTFGTSSAQEFDHVPLPNADGKIFVIENVSEICFVPVNVKLTNVEVLTALDGDAFAVPSYFPPVFTGSFSGSTDEYSGNFPVRLYHLATAMGTPLSIQINRNSSVGPGHCDVTLTGYLIDPAP